MTEGQKNTGLTPVRTARLIASLIALVGMVFLFLERALAAVLQMASEGVQLGLTRYDSFTGRMALQNFAEDRQLFKMLQDVQGLLPSAESALTVLLFIAIVLLAIAVVGLALPRFFVHILVTLKLLKWETDGIEEEGEETSFREIIANIGEIPLKKLAIPAAAIVVLVGGFAGIRSCQESAKLASVDSAIEDLEQHTLDYIKAQKAYFGRTKTVGGPKALQLPDTSSSDYFEYKVTGARFTAISRVPIENCPAGTKWSVYSEAKGVFTKELALYRQPPKVPACISITPNYKNIGRPEKKKAEDSKVSDSKSKDSTAKDQKAKEPEKK
ncbi:hypothetical protein SAMN05720473_101785 [Fibrobacter sp. UWB15]|uniref:hypothetical protein n=1 Tax=unclassified Fibrobacter TaxID=2634177 RepID=UPI00091EBEAD|nr:MULTISPECIES: hypothetical protein [unclassified Fibrobacter]PWJ67901.1 hypothetical protein BGW99_101785 [Fibrobacter sp. UWB6]SHF81524.1 hypothetical protein SAMN05720760_101750 [Fibrobacter sp. UWB8]SMG16126.1 hypothetical protein SAMN05720473_101785 [Fibrobacter sp. UWB15]